MYIVHFLHEYNQMRFTSRQNWYIVTCNAAQMSCSEYPWTPHALLHEVSILRRLTVVYTYPLKRKASNGPAKSSRLLP